MITSFKELFNKLQKEGRQNIVIAGGEDLEALKAAKDSYELGFGEAVLVGKEEEIQKSLQELNFKDHSFIKDIITVKNEDQIASQSVAEVKKGGILLKGRIKTAYLLKAVLDRENGLRTQNHLSDVFVFENQIEKESRLILMSDGGVNIKPDLQAFVSIIKNAVSLARQLGIDIPKVALLSAVETINPDMEETLQAGILSKMNERGQIADCLVDGPLALDNAISEFAVQKKKINSPVAGRADILVVPDIACGNIFGKSIKYFTNFPEGNLVVGASAPVLIPSRADKSETKLNSIALAILYSKKN